MSDKTIKAVVNPGYMVDLGSEKHLPEKPFELDEKEFGRLKKKGIVSVYAEGKRQKAEGKEGTVPAGHKSAGTKAKKAGK